MTTHETSAGVSRRRFMRGAAMGAGAAAVAAGTGAVYPEASRAQSPGAVQLGAAPGKTTVSGMVVRADHAETGEGDLAIGVRASIWHPALEARGVVLVVEPVAFGAAEEVNAQMADGLRRQVGELLAQRGYATDPEEIVVQLFGAAL